MNQHYDDIVYHANCPDGVTALWVAHRFWPDAIHHPVQYGEKPVLEKFRNREVLILDFSWPKDDLLSLADVANFVVVLDHHKTAQEDLEDIEHPCLRVFFDMERSGAGMTWDHFVGGERPFIVRCVEDRDLWRFAHPETKAVCAALSVKPLTVQSVEEIHQTSLDLVVSKGTAVLAYHDQLVASAAKLARDVVFDGYRVPFVESSVPRLNSDIGHMLAAGRPFAIVAYPEVDNLVRLEFRSSKERGLDVSKIAKVYGGGGHRNAAGCRISPKDLRDLLDRGRDSADILVGEWHKIAAMLLQKLNRGAGVTLTQEDVDAFVNADGKRAIVAHPHSGGIDVQVMLVGGG